MRKIKRNDIRINCRLMVQHYKNNSFKRVMYCAEDSALYCSKEHCLNCPHYLGQEFSLCGKLYFKRLK